MCQIQSSHGHVPGISWSPTTLPEAGPTSPRPMATWQGPVSPQRDVAALTDNSTGASHYGGPGPRPSHLFSRATRAAALNWALRLSRGLGSSWRSAEDAREFGPLRENVMRRVSLSVTRIPGCESLRPWFQSPVDGAEKEKGRRSQEYVNDAKDGRLKRCLLR